MKSGRWNWLDGICSIESGRWNLLAEICSMESDRWNLIDGICSMESARWNLLGVTIMERPCSLAATKRVEFVDEREYVLAKLGGLQ